MKPFLLPLGLFTAMTCALGCSEAPPVEGYGGGSIAGEVRVLGIPAGITEVTAEGSGGVTVRASVVDGSATLRDASLDRDINLHVGTLTWLHVRGRTVLLPTYVNVAPTLQVTLSVPHEAAFVAVLGREDELLATESLLLSRPRWQEVRASTVDVPMRDGDVLAWADASMTLGGLAQVPQAAFAAGQFDLGAASALTAFAPGLPTAPYGYAAVVGVPGVSQNDVVHVLVPGAWSIPARVSNANYWAIARTTRGDDTETVMVRDLDTVERPAWPSWLTPPTLTQVDATHMRLTPNMQAALHIVEVFGADGLPEHATWTFGQSAGAVEIALTAESHYVRARAFDVPLSDTLFDADAARHALVRFADTTRMAR